MPALAMRILFSSIVAVSFLWVLALFMRCQRFCANAGRWVPCAGTADPERALKVRGILYIRRRERFSKYVGTAFSWMCPALLAGVAASVWVESRQASDPDLVSNELTYAVALLTAIVIIVLWTWECSDRLTQLLFSLVYLFAAIPPSFSSSAMDHLYRMCISFLGQTYMLQIYPDRRMSLALSTVTLAWRLVTIALTPALSGSPASFVTLSMFAWMQNVGVSHSAMSTTESECEALFGERQAQSSSSCLESLLQIMTDAVVALKPDLSLQQPSQQLVSMLLRSPSLECQKFSDFLASPDVERFEHFVRASSGDPSAAGTIRVDLLDSMGGRVPVRVFHTCTRDPWDQSERHLLGLLEDAEPERPGCVPVSLREPPSTAPRDACESSDKVHGLRYWQAEEEPLVTVRTTFSVDVLAETESSRALFAFSEGPGNSFPSRFRKRQKFLRWLEFLYVLGTSGKKEHPRLKYGEVEVVNPTTGVKYRGMLKAKLLTVQQPLDEEYADALDEVDLALRSIDIQFEIQPLQPSQKEKPVKMSLASKGGPLARVSAASKTSL